MSLPFRYTQKELVQQRQPRSARRNCQSQNQGSLVIFDNFLQLSQNKCLSTPTWSTGRYKTKWYRMVSPRARQSSPPLSSPTSLPSSTHHSHSSHWARYRHWEQTSWHFPLPFWVLFFHSLASPSLSHPHPVFSFNLRGKRTPSRWFLGLSRRLGGLFLLECRSLWLSQWFWYLCPFEWSFCEWWRRNLLLKFPPFFEYSPQLPCSPPPPLPLLPIFTSNLRKRYLLWLWLIQLFFA